MCSSDLGEGKFSRQTGGKGQYGHVVIEMEPGEPESGFVFVNKIVGGVVPKEFIKPSEQGMKETCESGVIAGFPALGLRLQPLAQEDRQQGLNFLPELSKSAKALVSINTVFCRWKSGRIQGQFSRQRAAPSTYLDCSGGIHHPSGTAQNP